MAVNPEPAAVRYQNLVRMIVGRYFAGLTQRGYDFEDLVQEGLYAIMKAEPTYDQFKSKETTYYFHAAYNWLAMRVGKFITRKRRMAQYDAYSLDSMIPATALSNRRSQDDPTGLYRAGSLVAGAVDVEEMATNNVITSQLMARLAVEYPKQAKAVNLHYFRNMFDREVAEVMQCSRQNAAYLIARGLKNLRDYYTEQQGGQTA